MNPNCPDPRFPEFNPATLECFNTETVERTFHEHTQQSPIAANTLIFVMLVAIAGILIAKKK